MKKQTIIKILTIITCFTFTTTKAATIEEQIPDANLRTCITENLQNGKKTATDELTGASYEEFLTTDGQPHTDGLTDANLKLISNLECSNKKITNLKGIELLSNLTSLNLTGNSIETLSLSSTNNPKLTALYLRSTNIKTLTLDDTLTNNLKTLDISKNNLSTDQIKKYISTYKRLEKLFIEKNNYNIPLDVSGLDYLTGLWISGNKITGLTGIADKGQKYSAADGSEQTISLVKLVADSNKMSEINLSGNPNLTYLNISNNLLDKIDLSKNSKLKFLAITSNKLSALDLSANTLLEELYGSLNNLKSIDISKNTALKKLEVDDTSDVSTKYDLSKLEYLRTVSKMTLPVYKTLDVKTVKKFVPSNIKFDDYKVYQIADNGEETDVTNKKIAEPSGNEPIKLVLRPTSSTNSNITNYNGTYEYGAYYELSYFTLTSKRYKITDESIIVSNDDEETIKDNLESSFDDIDYEIEGLTLRLTYDGQTIKEFTLDRTGDIKKSDDPLSDDEDPEIQNPKTGVFVSIIGIMISAIGAYVGLNYCRKNSKIRNV